MKTTKNTILITGGSAGIGFEIAKIFSKAGNKVIITGRNEERLQKAAAQLENVTTIVSDVSKDADIEALTARIKTDFPELNIVINNAGNAYVYSLGSGASAAKAIDEMQTNYFSIINLNEQLIPVLNNHPEAAIVNVSSIVAFVPGSSLPTYSASKAALHSYTKTLRHTLGKAGAIKVFELMPPLVNTDFSQEIGGEKGIHPSVVATDLFNALETNNYEVRVGQTEDMYQLYRSSPADALVAMNG
jgi:uncharacterized oxidoreductase